jgi:hypothetical protein
VVNDDDLASRERALLITPAVAESLFFVLMIGGMYAALVWRPAAYVMLIGFTGHVLNHIAQGVLRYRMVMARPWPKVAPIDDDDDW